MIPKNIHLLFLRKDEVFPELFIDCLERIKRHHPGWNIRLYNEDDALQVLKEYAPQWLDVYNSFQYNVQKADFLRVVLVYLFGGFYLDLDMYCFNALDDLLEHEVVVAEEKMIDPAEKNNLNLLHRLRVANYMFGGISGHPFWLVMIREMIKRIFDPVVTQNDILETTGPGLLTNIYHMQKYNFPEITLIRNIDRKCVRSYHNAIACYFGNFAAHLHSGTWRAEVGKIQATGEKHPDIEKLISQPDLPVYESFILYIKKLQKNTKLKLYPNLFALYEVFSGVAISYKKNPATSARSVFLHFDSIDLTEPAGKDLVHILFIANHNYKEAIRDINLINENVSLCIVPDQVIYKKLLSDGLKIRTKVLFAGMCPIKRLFDKPVKYASESFVVGCSLIGMENKLPEMIANFITLKELFIPNLRICILHGYTSLPELFSITGVRSFLPKWIEFKSKKNDVSTWFHKIDCYLSLGLRDMYEFGPTVGLYLGVPVIIAKEKGMAEQDFYPYCCVSDEGIPAAIKMFYDSHEEYSNLAMEGAKWLETKYPNEKFKVSVLNLLNQ